MAARKTVKTSIRCLNCGKTFSNNKKGPVFGLCYTCRTNLNADANDFDLQLFCLMTGIDMHKMCIT